MKYSHKIIAVFFALSISVSACNTDELADLNIDPNALNEIDMSFLLAQVQLRNQPNKIAMDAIDPSLSGFVQLMAATEGSWVVGDKYLFAPLTQGEFFKYSYLMPVVDVNEIIAKTKDDPNQKAVYAMARVMRVVLMHRLTDLYGDVPYFEGGKGFISGDLLPQYDKQSDIYADMLKELEESATILSGSIALKKPEQDLIYGGDVTKWKKLANSLMLRLAMRLSNVDANMAQSWAKKAVDGGVLTSNADNALITHTTGPSDENRNPKYEVYQNDETAKLSKRLVDWLKSNDDPRMMVYSGGVGPLDGTRDMDPANQNGLPNGYDVVTIKDYEGTTEDVDLDNTYSRINPELVTQEAPGLILVYAEVELLQAEAAQRGWISSAAATHYNNGVKAAMTFYDVFPNLPYYVSEAEAETYLSAHPYVAADGIEMISTQYWALNFTNLYEAFANWRRTGFPTLVPVIYSSSKTNGTLPRRLPYLVSEASSNGANYLEAIQRQGEDSYNTRVWWDAQ